MSKILVIEDDEPSRANVLERLEAEGFEALGAENGQVGIQLAREHLPDLIICDIMMPVLDGYGVLNALRQDPATAAIPFIFLTAKADKSDLRRGMDHGADDYLTKPFTRADLLAAIGARLTKQASLRRTYQKKLDDLRGNITLALPHELNTPLTGILSTSELLEAESDTLERNEVQELAHIIHVSAERLSHLIQNFLLYAQLEMINQATSDTLRTRAENMSDRPGLSQLLAQSDLDPLSTLRSGLSCPTMAISNAALQQAQRADRQADLTLDIEDSILQIAELHLRKVVEELMDNAFRYSPPGTPVRVTGVCGEGIYALSVADAGHGMTAEQIANVGAFMQFNRARYEQQGMGLGLAIAKRLVELHGGKLTIESALDKGTTVRCDVPMRSVISDQ